MDMKKLLEAVDKFAGEVVGQKPGDQWKGTDKAPPGKKLVGDSILKDLNRGPTPKTKEQDLAEQFEQFLQALEEENLGTHPKRPKRTSDRPAREYTPLDKPSKRYKKVKEEAEFDLESHGIPIQNAVDAERLWSNGVRIFAFHEQDEEPHEIRSFEELRSYAPDQLLALPQIADESRGHKIIATKLGNMDRMQNVQIPTPQERQAQIAKQKEQQPKKQVKEYGANPPQGTAGQTSVSQQQPAQQAQQDPKQLAATNQALTAMKAATGSSAPTPNIAKALDAASQGKPVNQTDMKTLEPMMKDMATVAQDPKLAGQFKTLAQQIQQVQQRQQKP